MVLIDGVCNVSISRISYLFFAFSGKGKDNLGKLAPSWPGLQWEGKGGRREKRRGKGRGSK